MKIPGLPTFLLLSFASAAQATVYTDRVAFESAIDIAYLENFQSLVGATGNLGTSYTLPSGLTAYAQAPAGNELVVATPGFQGNNGNLLNPSTGIAAVYEPGPGTAPSSDGIVVDLGGAFEAVGFDYYGDLRNVGDYDIAVGRGALADGSAFGIGTPVGAFAAALAMAGQQGLPAVGFFGFVNDGNPDDVYDPFDPFVQGNVHFSNVFDPGMMDRFFLSHVEGSLFEVIDNVTTGSLASITSPIPVPEPATLPLLLAGLAGFYLLRRRSAG